MSKELNELITELGKIVDGNQSSVSELDKLKSLYEKLKVEAAAEFEYPFEENEDYWAIDSFGAVRSVPWTNHSGDISRYSQGNGFKTKEAAEREHDKRILLTKFRQFRDKCNGDWRPDWNNSKFDKFFISSYIGDFDEVEIFIYMERDYNHFSPFGYFKNEYDAKRALELFGNEIKRLWVEEK